MTTGRLGSGAAHSVSRPAHCTQLGGQAVFAALRGCNRAGTEGDLLLLPGGVEGGKVVGVFVRLVQSGRYDFNLRFGLGQRLGAREDRGVRALALLQPLPDRFQDVRGLAEQLKRLGLGDGGKKLQEQRQMIGSSLEFIESP